MTCDKCGQNWEIGGEGEYKNVYGTRCPYCHNLVSPEIEPKFVRDMKEKKQKVVDEYLPIIRKKIKEEIEE